jgi:hypothetical protein
LSIIRFLARVTLWLGSGLEWEGMMDVQAIFKFFTWCLLDYKIVLHLTTQETTTIPFFLKTQTK